AAAECDAGSAVQRDHIPPVSDLRTALARRDAEPAERTSNTGCLQVCRILLVSNVPQCRAELVGDEIRRIIHQLIERPLKIRDADAAKCACSDHWAWNRVRALDVWGESIATV